MEPGDPIIPSHRTGIWTILGVAAALLVPIGARHLSTSLEIYPAILMPVGAGTFDLTTERIPVATYELKALLEDGRTIDLEPRLLFGPISGRLWPRWAGSVLGTEPKRRQPIMGRIGLPPRPAATNEQRAELIGWLQQRAATVGIGPLHALYILRHDLAVDLSTGERIENGPIVIDTLSLAR